MKSSLELTESIKRQFMEAYPVFESRLSKDDFLSRIVSLGEEDGGNILRASLAYQLSQKCASCNLNVAMVLLCSAIEALKYKNMRPTQRFKKFLLDYCPLSLRQVPTVTEHEFPFDEALSHIYREFRSPYIHEALPYLDKPEKKNNIDVKVHKAFLYRGNLVLIELDEFYKWFSQVVQISLYNYLVKAKINQLIDVP